MKTHAEQLKELLAKVSKEEAKEIIFNQVRSDSDVREIKRIDKE